MFFFASFAFGFRALLRIASFCIWGNAFFGIVLALCPLKHKLRAAFGIVFLSGPLYLCKHINLQKHYGRKWNAVGTQRGFMIYDAIKSKAKHTQVLNKYWESQRKLRKPCKYVQKQNATSTCRNTTGGNGTQQERRNERRWNAAVGAQPKTDKLDQCKK